MKKKILFASVLVFFAFSLIFAGNILAQKPVELVFGHYVPPVGLMADQYRLWGDLVEKKTEGRVKVKFFWSNSLFSRAEALKSVADGIADFAASSAVYFPTQLPTALALDHGFNSSDVWVGVRAQNQLFLKNPELDREFERNGVKRVAAYNTGTFQWYVKGKWGGIEDFKGKVGRTMGGGRAAWYERMGMKPVFMSISDVYEAVSRGALWGFENTFNLANDLKHFEVISTLVVVNSGTVMSGGTLMNLKKFNSLSERDQKAVMEAGIEWGEMVMARALVERERTLVDEWKKKGIVVVYPPAKELAEMRKMAREAALDLARRQDERLGTPGRAVKALEALWAEVATAERELAERGYPWAKK